MIIASVGPDLCITPVATRIGAVIEGVRISGEIDDGLAAAIRAALLDHKVVFFRGQHHVGDVEMEGFARRMGDPIAHPTIADTKGSKYLLNLVATSAYASSIWHTDLTFMPAYPAASLIRTVEVPETGGDTMWANCAAAYRDLPEPLRAMVDRLWAFHSSELDFDGDYSGEAWDKVERFRKLPAQPVYHTEHPVVRVHPETGERILLTGTYIKRLRGFDVHQSKQILSLLQEYITRPENCMRWRWQAGDIALWDNRATQHRVVADFGDQAREMRRATISGTVPISVDGEQSRVSEGSGYRLS
jgi:taurine dioxygenase